MIFVPTVESSRISGGGFSPLSPLLRTPLIRRSRSFKVTDFGTNRQLIYDFLLVINANLPPILHRFGVIAFQMSKITIFCYPSCVYIPRQRSSPGTISVKFSVNVNVWPRYQLEGEEKLPKISSGRSRAHERYSQTTDGPNGDSI